MGLKHQKLGSQDGTQGPILVLLQQHQINIPSQTFFWMTASTRVLLCKNIIVRWLANYKVNYIVDYICEIFFIRGVELKIKSNYFFGKSRKFCLLKFQFLSCAHLSKLNLGQFSFKIIYFSIIIIQCSF